MKTGRRVLILFIFALLALTVLVALARRTEAPDFGDASHLLAQGYRGGGEYDDLVQFSTDAITLLPDTRVAGDAALVTLGGQPILVDGTIEGDLTAIGGDIILSESAFIRGDASIVGGEVTLLGRIEGDVIVSGSALAFGEAASVGGDIDACEVKQVEAPARFTLRDCAPTPLDVAFSALFIGIFSVAAGGFSALVVTIFPRQIAQMEDAIRRRPLRLTGAGVALIALFIGISAALALLSVALPSLSFVALLLFGFLLIAMALMSFLGGIPVYVLVGDWVFHRLRIQAPPLVAVLSGALLVTLVMMVAAWVPIIAWVSGIAWLLLFALGLGTALDTRLGTRGRGRSYFVQG
jgi:hypothetical protein